MGSNYRPYADILAMHEGVTGSCNLVIAKFPNGKETRFAVDCGLFQEQKYDCLNLKLPFNPQEVDFVLVTHNHVDHTGRLPFIVKNGFKQKIYVTNDTCQLLPLSLRDSANVLRDVAKRRNTKCLYSEANVSEALGYIKPCDYNETMQIDENIRVTFFVNGHLIGAALILVQISFPGYEDINLLFTGDYNNKNKFFNVEPLPKWVLDLPLTIVQESTYGYMDSIEIKPCFRKNIRECIQQEGTAISLVYSLGRAQEILYELKCMQEEKELDLDTPIYLDGPLAIKYTSLYLSEKLSIKEEMRNFLPEHFSYVDKSYRTTLLRDTSKKIILTTSGTGSYGPAQTYLPEYIKRENTLIQFTGFTPEGTLGSRLRNADINDVVEVGGMITRKKARVEYTTEYSAHAKADEMIKFLKKPKNLKLVLVNHGEPHVQKMFAKRIVDEVEPKDVGILGSGYIFRVNPYGLVKTISTKFE